MVLFRVQVYNIRICVTVNFQSYTAQVIAAIHFVKDQIKNTAYST